MVVTWLALFGIASQHLQVSIFLVLMMPMAFLTTTCGEPRRAHRRHRLGARAGVGRGLRLVRVERARYCELDDGLHRAVDRRHDRRHDAGAAAASSSAAARSASASPRSARAARLSPPSATDARAASGTTSSATPTSSRCRRSARTAFSARRSMSRRAMPSCSCCSAISMCCAAAGSCSSISPRALTGRMRRRRRQGLRHVERPLRLDLGQPDGRRGDHRPAHHPDHEAHRHSRRARRRDRGGRLDGGAMLPPVMGAVAFIMSDFTDIPYASIAWYAALPALLYYSRSTCWSITKPCATTKRRCPKTRSSACCRRAGARLAASAADRRADCPARRRLHARLCRGRARPLSVVLSAGSAGNGASGRGASSNAASTPSPASCRWSAPVAAAGIIIGAIEISGLAGKFTLLLFNLLSGGAARSDAAPCGAVPGPARHGHADAGGLHHGRRAARAGAASASSACR